MRVILQILGCLFLVVCGIIGGVALVLSLVYDHLEIFQIEDAISIWKSEFKYALTEKL